jgi:hypothetical protein
MPDSGCRPADARYRTKKPAHPKRKPQLSGLSPTDDELIPRPTGITAVWTRFFSIAVKQKKDIDFRLSGDSNRLAAWRRLFLKRPYGSR